MIVKNKTINYHNNALHYCERGGYCLITNKCFGNATQISSQMEAQSNLNSKCSKKYVHIKIRFAPEDFGKLVIQDMIDITKRYLHTMDLDNNPYAVYMHKEDTPEQHLHVVASRIKPNNLASSDEFTHYRNNDFCRLIEYEYQLRKLDRYLEKVKRGELFITEDIRINQLKELIDNALKISKSFDQFEELLKTEGVKILKGRGITFVDEDKVTVKGSKLGRDYSLSKIEQKFSQKKNQMKF